MSVVAFSSADVVKMPTVPIIETERLIFRGWDEDLLDGVAGFYADVENLAFIGGTLNREDSWRRIAGNIGHWVIRGFGAFALVERTTGRFVGYCGPIFPEGWPEPELCWGLGRPFQGRGLAAEAVKAARNYVYHDLRWPTVVSYIRPDNLPSQRLAQRVGAEMEKVIEFRGKDAQVWRHPAPSSLN